jgi:hypothetical protein
MSGGDYAVSKHIQLHRYLSIGVVLLGAIIYGLHFGAGYAIRNWAIFVFPLSLIWFSDQLSYWAIKASGYLLNSSNADVVLRVVGWIALIMLLGLRMIFVFPR